VPSTSKINTPSQDLNEKETSEDPEEENKHPNSALNPKDHTFKLKIKTFKSNQTQKAKNKLEDFTFVRL